jgi:lipopolysaccharide/colanic/teichoic acid biosynthesis glycosyltransferase
MTTIVVSQPRRAGLVAKRVLDVVVAGAALMALAPVFVLSALAVRLTSRGPVLFKQHRVGLDGRIFTMLKFRSMHHRADDGVHRAYVTALLTTAPELTNEKGVYKLAHDKRITRVGSVLRRLSIDELPQLINVLRGDMSLVGPRPALPFEVELYEAHERRRLEVRPGLTGLWQVSGRNCLSMKQMLQLDIDYVQRQSFLLDLKILLKTPSAVLRGDGAE